MNFKDDTFPAATFGNFFNSHGLVVTVRERAGELGSRRYFAMCRNASVLSSPGRIRYEVGNGSTREAAVLDYAGLLAGRRIVVDSMTPSRRELQCPNEWLGVTTW